LEAISEALLAEAERLHQQRVQSERLFGKLRYAATTWAWERRLIFKADVTEKGARCPGSMTVTFRLRKIAQPTSCMT
jgi:hypothetical protein